MSRPAVVPTPDIPPSPGPGADVEAGAAAKKESCGKMKALVLGLRASALAFSFLSFVLIISVADFTFYPALSYVLAIAVLVMIYTVVFVGIHGHEVRTGEVVIPQNVALWMNFLGDLILALLLLSSGSTGAEEVQGLRQAYGDTSGVGLASASVAMTFLAFISLEPAALISTFNFSVYIYKSRCS